MSLKDEHSSLANSKLDIVSYKNEKNIMMYPFCSTSKRKRIKPINYISDDKAVWLEVTANNTYGMAKIWDFDILRFVFSKISIIAVETNNFPSRVSFTAYECLKAIDRDPCSGKNFQWLRQALDRLASTTYKGNVFGDNTKKVVGFTLIKYEYEENENSIEKIIITLDERLSSSIKENRNLLKIDNRLIKENAGIKKRLLELVDVSMGDNNSWTIELKMLQNLCANDWELKRFKYELSLYIDLPWSIKMHKEGSMQYITFYEKF